MQEGGSSIVRGLYMYGTAFLVHERDLLKFHHHDQGFGTLPTEEAERIARGEHGSVKPVRLSRGSLYSPYRSTGVGTQVYYRKLGYELDGVYMSKSLL
ncbi:hypothetical protein BD769DRAFT_1355878 [Suillus cothurnatus]|nr:hypothetical protein BD769DRAFT_1355878 [Suillus cothurnatus]